MQQDWRSEADYPRATEDRDNPSAKRPRYESSAPNYGNGHSNYGQQQQTQQASREPAFEERTNMHQPSAVLHLRNVSEKATEQDVSEAAAKFGAVRNILLITSKRQALVEFADINDAIRLVKSQVGLKILGMDTIVSYSTSQKINREDKPHNILLMTILNPRYPIDVDVMHKICSPHGQVLRIVVFRKNGLVQSMVEFDSIDSAVRAKSYLNGADIYSGCCTLKIEFAKTAALCVTRNDKETWDYTRDFGPEQPPPRPPPLLEKPVDLPGGNYSDHYGNQSREYIGGAGANAPYDQRSGTVGGYSSQRGPAGAASGGGGGYDQYHRPAAPSMGPAAGSAPYDRGHYDRRTPPPSTYGSYPPPREYDRAGPGGPSQPQYDSYGHDESYRRDDRYGQPHYDNPRGGPSVSGSYGDPRMDRANEGGVAMLYGLNMERFNCDRLFNLFCLYGNVLRIKFLKSKEGSAMIQMGDGQALRMAIDHLHGLTIFGQMMQVTGSRQSTLLEVLNPYSLADGTPSYKDYSKSRNNRFSTPEAASKNRIMPPTKCLHFFNAPAGADEQEVEEVFLRATGRKPDNLIIMHGKSERSVSGFVEYNELEAAVESLILVNHTELANKSTAKGAFPYIFKVCFTQPNAPHTARAGQGPRRGSRQ